jgi:capsid protein
LKDIKAQMMAVRAGFKSRSEVVSEQGYDAEAIDREIAADNRRADDLGLNYDTDPRPEEPLPADESNV